MERLTPNRRRERTRAALLAAGVTVFAERGFHGASLDEVAEAAGYSKGAIYDHFGSKDDFFFAVIDHGADSWLARFAQLFSVDERLDPTPENVVARTSQILTEMLRPDRTSALLNAEAWLLAQRDEKARERLAAIQRSQVASLTRFIEDAVTDSPVRLTLPADAFAKLMIASSRGMSEFSLTDPESGSEELFPQLLLLLASASVELDPIP